MFVFLLCLIAFAAGAVTAVGDINYQAVTIELFMDNDLNTELPCNSQDNFTLTFKDVHLSSGLCTTRLFPQYNVDDTTKWLQFSTKIFAREDGGLQIWLYFTRNDNTGAITYCTEQNIGGMPYPLEISAPLNGQCYLLDLPNLDPYSTESADDSSSMAVRITYNQAAVDLIVANRTAEEKVQVQLAQDQAAESAEDTTPYTSS
ncbi:hypothetical protein BASA81_010058 [Batrachochytrium salamandrivorans]|nr:hypothetical protein BASA81_010058 [Batrachochytrium salamandrivorans]